MANDISPDQINRSSINLVRSSHSWTEADSAAGFVLRYITPMRRQLSRVLGSNREADSALKVLLTHLVSAGFGENNSGRLRDFLARAVRSCAKQRLMELGKLSEDKSELDSIRVDSKEWMLMWRECLLERAWRALERFEHSDPQKPYYTLLWNSTTNKDVSNDALAVAVKERLDVDLKATELESLKSASRAMFAQLLADEIVETLENPKRESVEKEIKLLGIGGAFSGLALGD